ncbi:hypothetical protein PoB_006908300 [Plakobranchus ocellatus]|uniref:Uncharacterized protein n=1 Tax=Plakobranchus ocellatus TaxID=259542 RepID=A0AAV4DET5_9GAST|nr:hypothetical protein PoB_006908300 [Plakobranchus ocellatus]
MLVKIIRAAIHTQKLENCFCIGEPRCVFMNSPFPVPPGCVEFRGVGCLFWSPRRYTAPLHTTPHRLRTTLCMVELSIPGWLATRRHTPSVTHTVSSGSWRHGDTHSAGVPVLSRLRRPTVEFYSNLLRVFLPSFLT